jgi:hypothetical protein
MRLVLLLSPSHSDRRELGEHRLLSEVELDVEGVGWQWL